MISPHPASDPASFSIRRFIARVLVIFFLSLSSCSFADDAKTRVFVLTDIENEPDDAQSMVRFLTYANHFDVEGLVATTSIHQQKKTAPERIRQIVKAYGEVQANLLLHEPGYPTAESLLSVVRQGRPDYGMNAVGEGQDSEGSDLLIAAADRDDARPLWVTVWGGPNVLAQALWKVQTTRSPEQLARFVAKLRVYTISDQDNSGPWIRKTFPGLFYIASPGMHAGGAYHYATWSGISGDKVHARFTGADFSLVDNEWLDKHIRVDHGPLGAQHPHTETYEWFYYAEVGTFTTSSAHTGQSVAIENFDQQRASFTVPDGRVMPGAGTMHVILAVTDRGTPALTRYSRVVVDVTD